MAKRRNPHLHGAILHRSRVVLLLVDVINAMDFPTGDKLARHALPAAARIARLRERAHIARVPVIYANDNFGRWRSDFRATIMNAQRPEMPGSEIAKLLEPNEHDYFVLKPKHSAFYGTSLDLLLSYFDAECVVVAGFAGDICVRFTAQDAFLRDFSVVVPADAIASEEAASNTAALQFMRERLSVRTPPSRRIDFRALARRR
ncbi:MAG TPA: isochorismatase family cysteine hydrolase [Kofleriaceae bacterium]|jgi:nicotinamidase-related amidase|nr:isochorismatase family cysteine hydrolase [Kofleriaceae bacterium]